MTMACEDQTIYRVVKITALKLAVQVHLQPEFHAVEPRKCVFQPKDILPIVSQVL